jgi:hypothetical protein
MSLNSLMAEFRSSSYLRSQISVGIPPENLPQALDLRGEKKMPDLETSSPLNGLIKM